MSGDVTTFGVEEEFLLFDSETQSMATTAPQVLEILEGELPGRVRTEFYTCQVEVVTDVCTSASELYDQILKGRVEAGKAARSLGNMLLAVGTAPIDGHVPVTDLARFDKMVDRFGHIVRRAPVCGMHIHVGVSDFNTAVKICSRLRSWLPIIQAMSVNSPFVDGVDTGYSSWRHLVWDFWPSEGVTPHMYDPLDYREAVDELILTGAALDENGVYWYARPSRNYPTVEIRVSDVCLTAEDATLVAVAVRALVQKLAEDIYNAIPDYLVSDTLLNGAHWRAARYGLEEQLVDPSARRLVSAPAELERLLLKITPTLDSLGDLPLFRHGVSVVPFFWGR